MVERLSLWTPKNYEKTKLSENLPPYNETQTLETAEQHIQLAVDLIYLLESNEMRAETVLKALDIVAADFTKKLAPN